MKPWLWFLLLLAGDLSTVAGSPWMIAGLATIALAAGGAVVARRRRRRTDDVLAVPEEVEEAEVEEAEVEPPPGFAPQAFVVPAPRLPTVDLARHVPNLSAASPRLAGLVQRVSEPDLQQGWNGGVTELLDVVPVLEQVLTELIPYAEQRGVELEPCGSGEAPEVWADWNALGVGMLEILLNAVDFAPEGSVVRVRLADLGLRTAVVVEDTGPALADEELCRVFPSALGDVPRDRPWGIDVGKGGRLEFCPWNHDSCQLRLAIPAFAPEREPHLQWL